MTHAAPARLTILARASARPEGRQYLDLVDEVEDTRYFGQESKGLVRKEVPVGRVNLGVTIYQGVSEPAEQEKK